MEGSSSFYPDRAKLNEISNLKSSAIFLIVLSQMCSVLCVATNKPFVSRPFNRPFSFHTILQYVQNRTTIAHEWETKLTFFKKNLNKLFLINPENFGKYVVN